jgi:hypothetical protein
MRNVWERYTGAFALRPDGSNAASHDRISGGRVGVAVVADAVDTTGTLKHEAVDDTSGQRIQTIQCCGFTATAIVQ